MSSDSILFDLPGELRNEVYKLVLQSSTLVVNVDGNGSADRHLNDTYAIRRVCNQVYAETKDFPVAPIDTVVIKPQLAPTPYGGRLPTHLFDLAGWIAASASYPVHRSMNITLRVGELDVTQLKDEAFWKREIRRILDIIPLEAIGKPDLHLTIDLTLRVGITEPIRILIPMDGSVGGRWGAINGADLRQHVNAALAPHMSNILGATREAMQGRDEAAIAVEAKKRWAALASMQYMLPWKLLDLYEIAANVEAGRGRKTYEDIKAELKAASGR